MKKINYTFSILTLVFTTLFSVKTMAQDAVFAQYYASPLHLNPAMMGVFQGQCRFNANYRQQWSGIFSDIPIRTIHAGFDYKVRVFDGDYFAFGINAMEDETGAISKLKNTRGNLGLSYMKQLGGDRYRSADQYLIFGAQVGMAQFQTTTDGLWFDRQYDSASVNYNTSLPSGEIAPRSDMFMDINAGILFYTVIDDNKSFYIGASAHHLTQPNISFLGNSTENLRRRFTVHGGGEFPLNDQLSFLPSVMATLQGPSMTTMFGGNFRYSNHDWQEVAVRVGGSYRLANQFVAKADGSSGSGILGDAFTITGMLELNSWIFGISYDIHTSSILKPTNGRGAWELSLIYVAPERIPYRTLCPKF